METVYVNDAEQWCENWRNLYKEIMSVSREEDVFRGFLIPLADIQKLAATTGAHAVRGYMAIKDPANPVPELLLVPVKHKEGEPDDGPGEDMLNRLGSTETFIYNFTRPCPVQCDVNSRLYRLHSEKKGKKGE
jgi:hypothetical protein